MIKVEVTYANDLISKIKVSGHANYDSYGQDIVCAGVSSVTTGLLNALDQLAKGSCYLSLDDNGIIMIEVNEIENQDVQLILKVGLIQLDCIIDSYPKYIKKISK